MGMSLVLQVFSHKLKTGPDDGARLKVNKAITIQPEEDINMSTKFASKSC